MSRTKPLIALSILTVVAFAGWYASRRFLSARPKNIIFILLDTTRADHLSVYGYERDTTPSLSHFAAESMVFEHAVASAPWTPPSVAGMFTGRYPSGHGLMPPNDRESAHLSSVRLDSRLETLAEKLQSVNYHTIGITPNPWTSREFGFDQGFDNYYFRSRARAAGINKAAFKVLEQYQNRPHEKPLFLFLHYLDPHDEGDKYDPVPPYDSLYSGALTTRAYSTDAQKDINLYDGLLTYLDHHLGILFDDLKARGLYDSSLIIVVADHGEQFYERGDLGHGFRLYDEEVHVPLIVKRPGTAPARISSVVSNLDVFATILDYAGVPVPNDIPSTSLFAQDKLARRPGVVSETQRTHNWKAFTSRDFKKAIFSYKKEPASAPELIGIFDLHADPFELSPLQDAAQKEFFLHSIEKSLPGNRALPAQDNRGQAIKPETLNQLRSLGYLK